MPRPPSCGLHVSFVLHGLGFVLLVVGYSTPSWTVVSQSAGDVHYLGLVVSCRAANCELLHVTTARDILVVVFAVSTANILLALFIAQLFCLSICNASFRQRNMGIALSYLSFLMALSVAVTQILYQIDLKDEHKPDVTSTMAVGWSRYLVIISSFAFLFGAFFSIADYNKRNQVRSGRRASVRSKSIVAVNVRNEDEIWEGASGQQATENVNDARLQKVVKSIRVAQNMAAFQGDRNTYGLHHSRKSHIPFDKSNVIMVDEVASGNKETRSNSGQDGQVTEPQCKAGIAIVADALKKYNLTKVKRSELIDGRHCLPTVEEEERVYFHTSQEMPKKASLIRQEAVSDDSSSDTSLKPYVSERPDGNMDTTQNNNTAQSQMARHCYKENDKRENISKNNNYRRSSTVENALLNVSKFLDKTVSGGHLIADYSFGSSNSKPSAQSSRCKKFCPPENKPSCYPIGRWRKVSNESNVRSTENSCLPSPSRNPDQPGKTKLGRKNNSPDNDSMYRSNLAETSGQNSSHRRGSKFQERLSDEQMKRKMILECLSRDLGKRRTQIRQ